MNTIYQNPSFYAHVINGVLMLTAFIILCKNYSKIREVEPYKQIVITLLFSLTVGVHGLSHMGLERIYHYNPIQQIQQWV